MPGRNRMQCMSAERTIELDAVVLDFLDGDVVHAHFRDGRVGSVADVKEMFDVMMHERQGRKALLVVSVGDGASLSNEARAYASSKESNAFVAADAIVVRDFAHQLSANAFVRHNRPHRPVQLFPDRDSAIAWLLQQRHLIDP